MLCNVSFYLPTVYTVHVTIYVLHRRRCIYELYTLCRDLFRSQCPRGKWMETVWKVYIHSNRIQFTILQRSKSPTSPNTVLLYTFGQLSRALVCRSLLFVVGVSTAIHFRRVCILVIVIWRSFLMSLWTCNSLVRTVITIMTCTHTLFKYKSLKILRSAMPC